MTFPNKMQTCFPNYLTLCKDIRLNVSVVVLARPHKSSRRLQHLGDHIIDKSVLVPDLQFVKLRLVVPVGSRTPEMGLMHLYEQQIQIVL